MRLKANVDLNRFFTCVRACRGGVSYRTEESSALNLKSQLCLFVFTANYTSGRNEALSGEIVCEDKADEQKLREFVDD